MSWLDRKIRIPVNEFVDEIITVRQIVMGYVPWVVTFAVVIVAIALIVYI